MCRQEDDPETIATTSGRAIPDVEVRCVDADGREVARGLVNYDAAESQRILGLSSAKVQEALGYPGAPELIHRDNLVLL